MEIMLPKGEKMKLAQAFQVSTVTVWKALTGQTNSEKAKAIRKAALERGGKVFEGSIKKKE